MKCSSILLFDQLLRVTFACKGNSILSIADGANSGHQHVGNFTWLHCSNVLSWSDSLLPPTSTLIFWMYAAVSLSLRFMGSVLVQSRYTRSFAALEVTMTTIITVLCMLCCVSWGMLPAHQHTHTLTHSHTQLYLLYCLLNCNATSYICLNNSFCSYQVILSILCAGSIGGIKRCTSCPTAAVAVV